MTSAKSGDESMRAEVDRRITEIRRRMDELDAELVALLNERARCAGAIGRLKETVLSLIHI